MGSFPFITSTAIHFRRHYSQPSGHSSITSLEYLPCYVLFEKLKMTFESHQVSDSNDTDESSRLKNTDCQHELIRILTNKLLNHCKFQSFSYEKSSHYNIKILQRTEHIHISAYIHSTYDTRKNFNNLPNVLSAQIKMTTLFILTSMFFNKLHHLNNTA